MTSPPVRRKSRTHTDPAFVTTPIVNSQCNADAAMLDYDRRVVDGVDRSIWQALYNGHFRLAVRCERCGRWLTDGRSKKRRHGSRCAAKAGGGS